ncbi:hypothetical protein HDV05_008066 [Chytridiales sp. JEL 0842]|nr:hypothetical protein HDV05_008066 [Chytridiales sp. JEL 0842]
MGCGASKNAEENTLLTTSPPKPTEPLADVKPTPISDNKVSPEPTPSSASPTPTSNVDTATASAVTVTPKATSLAKLSKDEVTKSQPLTRAVVPSIAAAETGSTDKKKPIAFEIPLDEDLKAPKSGELEGKAPMKVSLPKLNIDEKEIMAKLANSESRWKEMDEAQAERSMRKKGDKPALSSSKDTSQDPALLKKKLLEKEAQAAMNRLREIEKVQSKLAKQEERAKKVLERKKMLGQGEDELNLSWGGEDSGLAQAVTAANKALGKDTDSGKDQSREESRQLHFLNKCITAVRLKSLANAHRVMYSTYTKDFLKMRKALFDDVNERKQQILMDQVGTVEASSKATQEKHLSPTGSLKKPGTSQKAKDHGTKKGQSLISPSNVSPVSIISTNAESPSEPLKKWEAQLAAQIDAQGPSTSPERQQFTSKQLHLNSLKSQIELIERRNNSVQPEFPVQFNPNELEQRQSWTSSNSSFVNPGNVYHMLSNSTPAVDASSMQWVLTPYGYLPATTIYQQPAFFQTSHSATLSSAIEPAPITQQTETSKNEASNSDASSEQEDGDFASMSRKERIREKKLKKRAPPAQRQRSASHSILRSSTTSHPPSRIQTRSGSPTKLFLPAPNTDPIFSPPPSGIPPTPAMSPPPSQLPTPSRTVRFSLLLPSSSSSSSSAHTTSPQSTQPNAKTGEMFVDMDQGIQTDEDRAATILALPEPPRMRPRIQSDMTGIARKGKVKRGGSISERGELSPEALGKPISQGQCLNSVKADWEALRRQNTAVVVKEPKEKMFRARSLSLKSTSAQPTPTRNHSALVFRSSDNIWLFDCGEGTQHQFLKLQESWKDSSTKKKQNPQPAGHSKGGCRVTTAAETAPPRLSHVSKIFLSHMHGDHCFGLPGFMCTRGGAGPAGEAMSTEETEGGALEVYGPQGTRRFVREGLKFNRVGCKFRVIELLPPSDGKSGLIWRHEENKDEMHVDELLGADIYPASGVHWEIPNPLQGSDEQQPWAKFRIYAAEVPHTVTSLAYAFFEPPQKPGLNAKYLTPLLNSFAPRFPNLKNPMMLLKNLQNDEEIKDPTTGEVLIDPHDPKVRLWEMNQVGIWKRGRGVLLVGDTSAGAKPLMAMLDEIRKENESESDTKVKWEKGVVDVIIHEATNSCLSSDVDEAMKRKVKKGEAGLDIARVKSEIEHEVEALTISHGHSTPQIAGNVAKEVGARTLLLNHFSGRYKGDESEESLKVMDEIRDLAVSTFFDARDGTIDKQVICTRDFMGIVIEKL